MVGRTAAEAFERFNSQPVPSPIRYAHMTEGNRGEYMETARSQLPGAALPRDISSGEKVDADIERFIATRHEKRVRDEGRDRAEEVWKASARKHAAKQRQQARLEWHLHHQGQAERLRRTLESLIAHHEQQAEKLGGDAA
jgi:hypothetical protein